MLPAAAGEQRLRSLFSGSQGEDGAVLLNGKGDGPFAVPGLDARVFTSLRPGEGRIIDVDADASTEHYTQTSHKEERSGSHDGDMAQPVSGDGTAAFGTGTDPAQGGFGPSAVFASQTASGSAAPGGGASAGKQASSTVRTDHGAPADKKGRYLVRMPLDALVVADSPGTATARSARCGTTRAPSPPRPTRTSGSPRRRPRRTGCSATGPKPPGTRSPTRRSGPPTRRRPCSRRWTGTSGWTATSAADRTGTRRSTPARRRS
ncbi:hypothetical protein ACFQXA_21485 [Nocardiopsis composta]